MEVIDAATVEIIDVMIDAMTVMIVVALALPDAGLLSKNEILFDY